MSELPSASDSEADFILDELHKYLGVPVSKADVRAAWCVYRALCLCVWFVFVDSIALFARRKRASMYSRLVFAQVGHPAAGEGSER